MGIKQKEILKKDPDAVQSVRRFWHFVKNGRRVRAPDCLAFAHSHVCETGTHKVRAVWGYPATMTFGEAVFARPLIEAYKEMPDYIKPIAYGFETTNGGMKKVCRRFSPYTKFAVLDFKSFDKKVPAWLIDIAFDILLENIDLASYQDHGFADARRMLIMFFYTKKYFIETVVRISTGDRYKKTSGITSGSYFTQLVGSVVNCILINWISLRTDGVIPDDSLFMGDDSLIVTRSLWNIDFCQQIMRSVGMELNMEKTD